MLHIGCLRIVWAALLHVSLFCLEPVDFLGKLFSIQMLEACRGAVEICDSISLRLRTGSLSHEFTSHGPNEVLWTRPCLGWRLILQW